MTVSELWDVDVIDKGKNWIDLELSLAHPDAGAFPEDPIFALELLTNEAYEFDDDYNRVPTCPLGEEFDFDKSYLPDDLAPHVARYIEDVVLYEARNLPWDEEAAHRQVDEEVLEMGIERGDDRWDDAWEERWIEFWCDVNNLPLAKYRITVTDPKWIDHLAVGDSYSTASFSTTGPWVNEDRTIELEQPADSSSRVHIEGFAKSEVPPRDSDMQTEMIRNLAMVEEPLGQEAVDAMVVAHLEFLDSGGRGGRFERLEVSGIPLNVYTGAGEEGEQLVMRSKRLEAGVSLTERDLSYGDFSGSICEGVDFTGTNFEGAILTDAFFKGAVFDHCDLEGVDLTGSDLSNASFRGANLKNADLEIANCAGANLTDANLTGAVFPGANLDAITR